MARLRFERREDGVWTVRAPHRGRDLLNQPMLNRGTAFEHAERRALGLDGLLPHGVSSFEAQTRRAHGQICRKDDPLERYIGLVSLQDRNETLFHRVLWEHVEELMPIVYTPTVGEACRRFSDIFRRGRGLWITPDDRGRIAELLANVPYDDVRLIVATDNERILGLGDQGAGGIGIPIGKLALYTMAAGIHPTHTLPISLDVGTDNPALLSDPLYVGWKRARLRGADYDALLEEFVEAVRSAFPAALLQWEDFKKGNAFALLDRYRERLPSFNDDIQGTASVALAGVLAACRAKGEPLARQRVAILGAGAAGIGIARQLRDAFRREGVEGDALTRAVAVLDSGGLLSSNRELRDAYKREFLWPAELARASGFDLERPVGLTEVVATLAPTVLVGTSGEPGAFDERVVRAMAESCERPAIFPFSNPTSKSEATPADLLAWTGGRALIATGSPYDPVEIDGRRVEISQGNNVYVFPGVGLGALVAEAREVTDSMFTVAARALAESVSDMDLADGTLMPRLTRLRDVTRHIAAAVVREARELGLGRAIADEDVAAAVEAATWTPEYPRIEPI